MIKSSENPKLKYLTKLAKSGSFRYANKEAIIYGEHLIIEALKHGVLRKVFVASTKSIRYTKILSTLEYDAIYLIDEVCLKKIKLSDSEVEIVATVGMKFADINQNIYQDDCLVLEGIQDPGNLGTIMRSCQASGVHTLILGNGCADPYSIKVIRASQGVQFGLNLVMTDVPVFLQKYRGIIWATSVANSKSIYQCDLKKKSAWVFGNEGSGLSENILNNQKVNQVSIPMQAQVDSLNVAMAATICLFETMRQRLSDK